MEKASLTQKQAEALENATQYFQDLNEMINCHANEAWSAEKHQPLLKLDYDTFCRALYIGYKIIEEDQVVTVTESMRKSIVMAFNNTMNGLNPDFEEPYAIGVRGTLDILGIKIVGVNT